MISEWSTGEKKGSCLEITIYTTDHGPEEEGGNMKKTAVHRNGQPIQQIILQVKVALR